MTDGPRLIGRREAATYCGIAESTFSLWVAQDKMPPPVPGTRKWDKRAIDARLDEISGLATPPARYEDDFDRMQRESDERRLIRDGHTRSSDYDDWKRKKQQRDKHRPLHNLDAREERVVRFMIDHTEYMTTDAIPNAGEKTMEDLMKRGVVRPGNYSHGHLAQLEVLRRLRMIVDRRKIIDGAVHLIEQRDDGTDRCGCMSTTCGR